MPLRYTAVALLLSLPLLSVAAQSRGAADPIRDLDAYTAKAVADWKVPGLAIAVVKDGRIVFAKGYGVRELGKQHPHHHHQWDRSMARRSGWSAPPS